ncbi:homocysteine S-methyltransferase family protein [Roseobacter sp. HKCCA0434]|uniref:homocysteine S-methyltransferase family protein n=1 Tax=Roseobacter sp. HKCCA0434 TaxID=3079297 RepID=UPI002905C930|nr:homocysteine S-methyltransferase family protein [Roseobacter sp. HKCCA0434]
MRALYRNGLPQVEGAELLTDAGLETTLIFLEGHDLPCFASYPLLGTSEGRQVLKSYFQRHLAIAADHGTGFLLEAPTWRASRDWGAQLGHSPDDLARFNKSAIDLLVEVRREASSVSPIVISGNIGPRGDGYQPDMTMSAEEAQAFHAEQIGWFVDTEADMVSAFTISTVNEGVGIVRAAAEAGMLVVLSYTTETDGRLPDGTPLGEAFERTDELTDGGAAYFMINCAHPDHFRAALESDAAWLQRVLGVRANASRQSHAELDEAEELDAGNPAELGRDYAQLKRMLPNLRVYGGCCGTDHRHIEAMADCCCRIRAA